jgi:hypothetical protein
MPRPFARGWCAQAIQRAQEAWAEGLNRVAVNEWLAGQLQREQAS